MENSGAVTIEGENYEVLDECMEEEDTSNGMQLKCLKNMDIEKQSMDSASLDMSASNKNIKQNKDINIEKNDTNIEEIKNINIKNNEEIIVKSNENINIKNSEEIIMENNENKNTNIKNNEEIIMENNENIKNNEEVIMENNENIKNNEEIIIENNENIKNNEEIIIENNENIKNNEEIIIENNENIKNNEEIIMKSNENIKENKNINTKNNKETIMENNENIKENENINIKNSEEIIMENNENKNTNIKNNEEIIMENNENIKEKKNINMENNENIKEKKNINMKDNKDIIIENNEKVSVTESTNNSSTNNNIQNNSLNTESRSPQESNVEPIDFTADITLDQLDNQRDVTDEDVLHHLDEIENIVLDSADFQIQEENRSIEESTENQFSNLATNKCVKNDSIGTNDKMSLNINEDHKQETKVEKPEENDWYKKKLTEKEAIVKERLTKVARVLAISYPCYDKWLEYEEKINGSPLCKLKPPRHCCLDKPYTNRWKFICSKKEVQKSITKSDNNDAFYNKNIEVIWKLEASGAWGVNINDESQFPPFVLHAVKIFEDFLQTTEQLSSQNSMNVNFTDDVSMDVESKKDTNIEARQEWLWLVVRCNSMDELMLFATGKNITRSTMDRLKQVYESGSGKDCNVKSLYCKSTNKYDDTTVTDTTFLVGSEALDEIVGGLKVQLAPKTNFWSNTAGAENVANAVIDLLVPTPKTTVLEIGCGIGLIGLMMASKCQQIIGVDSPSEVEEAELTCELNNIKNASFIMGSPTEVPTKIIMAVKNRKTCAIINANTNIGRAIEVMTCLRKIPSLKRIVMITTLTKQSVRAILELARPRDHNHGLPFIPILACVVDTLPIGAHFEAVILLQRRMINKFNHLWFQKNIEGNIKKAEIKNTQENINEQKVNETDIKIFGKKATELQTKKNFNKSLLKAAAKKSKLSLKKASYVKNADGSFGKNKFKRKRAHSPDTGDVPVKKLMKKFNKFGAKRWHTDVTTKNKKEWNTKSPQLHINPLYEKKMREYKEQTDLRERLSNNRLDTDIAQTVKEHQALLEIAKEKLSGPAPTVDVNTAKQLQNMLNMVLEQTNKLQNQLPRSVWDRIAPPENMSSDQRENKQDDPLFKNHYIQEMNSQDILITTSNKKFLNNEELDTKPMYKKYGNLPPLEPNRIMPVGQPVKLNEESPFHITSDLFHETGINQQQAQENSWRRDKNLEKSRWNEMGNMKRLISPMRRQTSPLKHCISSPKRLSPKRPLLSPPKRPCSPPRRHFSPVHRSMSPIYRQRSPIRRQMSPVRRPVSPKRMSPSRRPSSPRRLSPPRRSEMIMDRPMSPLRRHVLLLRRQMSPAIRFTISSKRQSPPMKRPLSPLERQITSPGRILSPNQQEMLLSRRQTMLQERQQTSSLRRAESPPRFLFDRSMSPSKRQQSPQRRKMSPQKYADDWDIPSRGTIEQLNWSRNVEHKPEQNMWQTDKTPSFNSNWKQTVYDDKRRKTLDQETWESVKDPVCEDTWNNSGNTWNSKQPGVTSMLNETWLSSADRWSTTSNIPGSSNDNWNIHGKESFTACKESWMDSKKQGRRESLNVKDSWKQLDKEDLNDLPEDAKDPWGDDGTLDLKERWLKSENTSTSSTWVKENEQQGDSWIKHHKDNWSNKGLPPFGTKSQWQNNGVQNIGESRWIPQNDIEKRNSGGWKNGNTAGSWQFQNSNLQSRPFSTTQFKGSY